MTRTCKKNRGKYEDNVRKTFILNFNKWPLFIGKKVRRSARQGGGMRMWSSMMGGGGTIIKRKDKQYSNDKEYMGKEFLIKDSL
jgi:hypothetical protein